MSLHLPGTRTQRILAASLVVLLVASAGELLGVEPGSPVVLDSFADALATGGFGTAFVVDRSATAEANAAAFAGHPDLVLPTGAAFEVGGDLIVTDREADPSGLGVVAGGGAGPGALFRAAGVSGEMTLLSDGSQYAPGLPGGIDTVFVEPAGVAVLATGEILVADLDADPSQLGADPNGLPGHGALFTVDPVAGLVDLVADGSDYPAGLPAGEESVLVDPVGVAVGPGGEVYLLDAEADPLGLGHRGALFRVLSGGTLELVASPPELDRPADLAVLPDGEIAVVGGHVEDGRGAVWLFDPVQADPGAPAAPLAEGGELAAPTGVAAAPNGWLFLMDPFADPLGLGRFGALFRLDPAEGVPRAVSSDAAFRDPLDVALPPTTEPPPGVDGIDPSGLLQGEISAVTVQGSDFQAGARLSLGAGIAVTDTTVLDPATLTATVEVALDAPIGPREVRIDHPDLQAGTLAGGFEVTGRPAPVVAEVVPPRGARGARLEVEVSGQNLDPDAVVELGAEVLVLGVVPVDPSLLRVTVEIDPAATLGLRDVTVTNPDTLSDTLPSGFEVVLPPPPRVDLVEPARLSPGARMDLEVRGDGFRPGATVGFGPGVRVLKTLVEGPELVRALCWVEADAVPGPRLVEVRDPETGAGSLPDGVEVLDAPLLELAGLRVLDDDPAWGNGSSRADPGETVELVPTLRNRGNASAIAPEVHLFVDPPLAQVEVEQSFVVLPDLEAGATATRSGAPHLRLRIGAGVPCGEAIPLRLELRALDREPRVLWGALFVGGPEGWTVDLELSGGAGDRQGAALSALGDVDGDGRGDWAVGAPGRLVEGLPRAGRVLVYSGGGGELVAEILGEQEDELLGAALAGPGDLDGDGAADLVVASPGAAGGAGRIAALAPRDGRVLWELGGEPGERLGASLAAVGDVDGDGTPDLAVGAPGASPGGLAEAGAVLLLRGTDGLLLDRREGEEPGALLGTVVAAAPDGDGDGLPEWVAGAPGASAGAGMVVARGLDASGGTDRWVVSGDPGEGLGIAASHAADLDADGWPDLALGATASGAGSVRLVDRTGRTFEIVSGASGDETGAALAPAGDADGDGRADLWIGSPGRLAGAGELVLREGGSGPALQVSVGPPGGGIGTVLAPAGDLDGDGWPDLLAGMPSADPEMRTDAGLVRRLASTVGCRPFTPCLDDPHEPNDSSATAAAVAFPDTVEGLVLCRDDEDWFRLEAAASLEIVARARTLDPSARLDLLLLREDGTLLDADPGAVSLAEVDAALDPGSYRLQVGGAGPEPVGYTLELFDPAGCPPVAEIRGLRVERAGEQLLLRWDPDTDPCRTGYLAWEAATAAPSDPDAGMSFPDDPPFVLLEDRDGDPADAAARVAPSPGRLRFLLVVGEGGAGDLGPARDD